LGQWLVYSFSAKVPFTLENLMHDPGTRAPLISTILSLTDEEILSLTDESTWFAPDSKWMVDVS
jgi:hypothetical protein